MIRWFGLLCAALMVTVGLSSGSQAALLISEIDCDTTSTDDLEFIEIMNTGPMACDFSTNPVTLVFFDGGKDWSYQAVQLTGTLASGGLLLVGNSSLSPQPDIVIPQNSIQNGADAVALYSGNASDWPDEKSPIDGYLDAIVYDTDDADDPGLLAIFSTVQINENQNRNKDGESIQRVGTGYDAADFIVGSPTPGVSAVVPLPGAVYLLGAGLVGLLGVGRHSKTPEK